MRKGRTHTFANVATPIEVEIHTDEAVNCITSAEQGFLNVLYVSSETRETIPKAQDTKQSKEREKKKLRKCSEDTSEEVNNVPSLETPTEKSFLTVSGGDRSSLEEKMSSMQLVLAMSLL